MNPNLEEFEAFLRFNNMDLEQIQNIIHKQFSQEKEIQQLKEKNNQQSFEMKELEQKYKFLDGLHTNLQTELQDSKNNAEIVEKLKAKKEANINTRIFDDGVFTYGDSETKKEIENNLIDLILGNK